MLTKIIRIEDKAPVDETLLEEAAGALREGGLVAFPTETVYGLGGNALDAGAARKIYAAKGRPSDNPLIVHISSMEELAPLVKEIPEKAKRLAEAYWPGPMTMIFRKSPLIPPETSGGLDTVAVRMPSDPVASALIRLSGVPVAAPSANTSGRPSPTTAEHVIEDMDGRIDYILDGGPVPVGVESTIVDLSGSCPVLLRPGAVTLPMLEKILGHVELDPVLTKPLGPDVHPKAPGMKYRHYAPKAEMILVETKRGGEENLDLVVREINLLSEAAVREGRRPGILATDETAPQYRFGEVRSIGHRADEASVAHNLFAVLREFDSLGVDVIYSEAFPEDDLGLAIMNRMNKAAGHHHILVREDGSTCETSGGGK